MTCVDLTWVDLTWVDLSWGHAPLAISVHSMRWRA
ncbi:hypothetical protein [Bradyrhizobium liaoningense]